MTHSFTCFEVRMLCCRKGTQYQRDVSVPAKKYPPRGACRQVGSLRWKAPSGAAADQACLKGPTAALLPGFSPARSLLPKGLIRTFLMTPVQSPVPAECQHIHLILRALESTHGTCQYNVQTKKYSVAQT